MEKVTGIDIVKNDLEIENVIVNFINDNKEKFSKQYSLDSEELKKIIEVRKKQISKELPTLKIKNKKYKNWNFLLRIAAGLFIAMIIISFASLFLFNVSLAIPSILSILFLAISYVQVHYYGNSKNVFKEGRYNIDLRNIEEILEEMNTKKNRINSIVNDNVFKNMLVECKVKTINILPKMLDCVSNFSLQVGKQIMNIYFSIVEDLKTEDNNINSNKKTSTSNEETIVQKVIRNREFHEIQHARLERALRHFEDSVYNEERVGRRR